MPQSVNDLIVRLRRMRDVALNGAAKGLDEACPPIEAALKQTDAHGDITGATRAAYAVWRVGRGETGAAKHAASVANGERNNPGATETNSVSIGEELGVIISDPMNYAADRETRNAGEKATVGPMLQSVNDTLTDLAAEGSKRALGGG
jgi:hypothetical protein